MNRPYQNFWGENKIGQGTKIGAYVEIGNDVEIGEDCLIEAFSFIPPKTRIKNKVFIGPHVCITNDKYPPSDTWSGVTINTGASIGANTTILPGVTIGEYAKIGGGSVVTKDVPPNETWCGNPAKKMLNCPMGYSKCVKCGGCDEIYK